MRIGVPKETVPGEARVAATPDTVNRLRKLGVEVAVERDAGRAAGYVDEAYGEAGAEPVDAEAALAADVVLKVRRPSAREVEALRKGAVLAAFLEPYDDDGTLERLARAGVDALAVERIPRISRAQSMDALSSQANIAGYRAVVEAASHYRRFFPMMMTAAGSTRPARVIVLGAGVAGLQAIATARRLGAEVEAFDVRPEVKEQVQSLGAGFIELEVGESGAGEGGYARELSEEGKRRQQAALTAYLPRANAIVSTALVPGRRAPVLITEEAVQNLGQGSVIVDLAAASGGNCPLTRADEVIVRDGVVIVGHTNYPAMVAGDASAFYARNLMNLIALVIDPGEGALRNLDEDEITRSAQVTRGGDVVFQAH